MVSDICIVRQYCHIQLSLSMCHISRSVIPVRIRKCGRRGVSIHTCIVSRDVTIMRNRNGIARIKIVVAVSVIALVFVLVCVIAI